MASKDIIGSPETAADGDKRRMKNGVIIYAIIEALVLIPLLLYLIFR